MLFLAPHPAPGSPSLGWDSHRSRPRAQELGTLQRGQLGRLAGQVSTLGTEGSRWSPGLPSQGTAQMTQWAKLSHSFWCLSPTNPLFLVPDLPNIMSCNHPRAWPTVSVPCTSTGFSKGALLSRRQPPWDTNLQIPMSSELWLTRSSCRTRLSGEATCQWASKPLAPGRKEASREGLNHS